jgi:hypothetical protein
VAERPHGAMVPLSGAKAGVVGMHSRSFGARNDFSLRKYSSRRLAAGFTRRRSKLLTRSKICEASGPNAGLVDSIQAPRQLSISAYCSTP